MNHGIRLKCRQGVDRFQGLKPGEYLKGHERFCRLRVAAMFPGAVVSGLDFNSWAAADTAKKSPVPAKTSGFYCPASVWIFAFASDSIAVLAASFSVRSSGSNSTARRKAASAFSFCPAARYASPRLSAAFADFG